MISKIVLFLAALYIFYSLVLVDGGSDSTLKGVVLAMNMFLLYVLIEISNTAVIIGAIVEYFYSKRRETDLMLLKQKRSALVGAYVWFGISLVLPISIISSISILFF